MCLSLMSGRFVSVVSDGGREEGDGGQLVADGSWRPRLGTDLHLQSSEPRHARRTPDLHHHQRPTWVTSQLFGTRRVPTTAGAGPAFLHSVGECQIDSLQAFQAPNSGFTEALSDKQGQEWALLLSAPQMRQRCFLNDHEPRQSRLYGGLFL